MTAVPAEAVQAALDALTERTALGADSDRQSRNAAKWIAVVALEAGAPSIAKAERAKWAETLCEMAAAVLPRISTTGNALQILAKADPSSPRQVQGRLLLDIADLLRGAP